VMTKLRWTPAPKQPGRWVLVDPDVMEMQADVWPYEDQYMVAPRLVARTCKWPGTDGRLFDTGPIQSFASINTAKRWCEQQLGLPACEDA